MFLLLLQLMAAKKKPATVKPKGLGDDIGRGINMAGKVVYEVSGAGDAVRFAKNPSLKNAAMLGLTVAAYAAGPAAKAAQAGKVIKATSKVAATADVRAEAAAVKAANTSRVVKATKGAGTVTTKSGTALPMTGIKSFSTAKSPARASASTYSMVQRDAVQAGKDAGLAAQKYVTRGKMAGGGMVIAKGTTTVSVEKQKNKQKKK